MSKRFLSHGMIAAFLAVLSSHFSADAEAQEGGNSKVRFDAHLNLGWYRAFGLGMRADIPVVKEGLVSGVADDLAISLGGDLYWFYDNSKYNRDDGWGLSIPVVAQWNFYINDKWSVFPELGLAVHLGPYVDDYYWGSPITLAIGLGGRYHFSSRNALLLRLAWPGGLQFGITF